ncbi:MAG: VOC family protein [Thermomicrobiales bacterium]
MPTGIDHIVIAVRDLEQTSTDCRRAGFTVVPGGEHKDGTTHNALVSFADGAYFELIAFKEPDREQEHKWWHRLAKGEGLVDYALRTDDLQREVADLRRRGLQPSDPIDGGRFRPDGQRLDWQTIRFEGASSPALPFYCFDLTDRALRVPGGDATAHANGVTGVSGVTVVVGDIDAAAAQFAALSGVEGTDITSELADASSARRYPVGNAWIAVAQPTIHPSDLRQQLELRGDSIFSVSLIATDGGDASIPIGLAHGARLLLPVASPAG